MSKGFFMSVDGLFAIAVVLVTMGAFATYYHAADDYSRATEIKAYEASDTAMVGFYIDEDAAYFGLHDSIDPAWDYGICAKRFIIEFNNNGNRTPITEKTFCIGDNW